MSKIRRIVLHEDDDASEAYKEFKKRKEAGEEGIAFADVRNMTDPPKTVHRWIVYRLVED